jgi:hypothetical protein
MILCLVTLHINYLLLWLYWFFKESGHGSKSPYKERLDNWWTWCPHLHPSLLDTWRSNHNVIFNASSTGIFPLKFNMCHVLFFTSSFRPLSESMPACCFLRRWTLPPPRSRQCPGAYEQMQKTCGWCIPFEKATNCCTGIMCCPLMKVTNMLWKHSVQQQLKAAVSFQRTICHAMKAWLENLWYFQQE